MPTEITTFEDPRLDVFARLSENQLRTYYEPAPGLFIAESLNVITRALEAGYEPVSLLIEDKEWEALKSRDDNSPWWERIPVFRAKRPVLEQITGYALTRGMLCAMRRKRLLSAEEILQGAKRVAVLEDVMNPVNIGSIFRSAAALNMDAVLLSPGCSDPLYRRAARVSMGTVFQIPWTILPGKAKDWPLTGPKLLKEYGFTTIAMALKKDSLSIDDPRLRQAEKSAVFMGSEGYGLCDQTIRSCDYTVCIPMSHGVDSLNVAAASAIAFWNLGATDVL
ncbi:MAG: RNA methyltransferase [Lachnospiraceae bacterium]|nr:RNA methyltransferase [Lachnospiraceae bacterium]